MSEYIEMTESEFAEFINEFDREELIDAQTELQKDTELPKAIRGKFIFPDEKKTPPFREGMNFRTKLIF